MKARESVERAAFASVSERALLNGALPSAVTVGREMYRRAAMPSNGPRKLVWLDTGWACGGVEAEGVGSRLVIVDGAPIFRKLRGQDLRVLRYKWRLIE